MRQSVVLFAAFGAWLTPAPAVATVTTTNWTATSSIGTGSFSLDLDSSTSSYSLSAFNFSLPPVTFDTTTAGLANVLGNTYLIGGNESGVPGVFIGHDDFAFTFDPTLASQTANLDYVSAGGPLTFTTATVTQTGSSGTTTDYSIASDALSGTFTLDVAGSTYSLTALDLTLGPPLFDTTNTGLVQTGSNVLIGGEPYGVLATFVPGNDFSFQFDPSLGSQTTTLTYGLGNSPGIGFTDLQLTLLSSVSLPEPATWAMMLLGFAAVGLALRGGRRGAFA